jgi:hypothetical protein
MIDPFGFVRMIALAGVVFFVARFLGLCLLAAIDLSNSIVLP